MYTYIFASRSSRVIDILASKCMNIANYYQLLMDIMIYVFPLRTVVIEIFGLPMRYRLSPTNAFVGTEKGG